MQAIRKTDKKHRPLLMHRRSGRTPPHPTLPNLRETMDIKQFSQTLEPEIWIEGPESARFKIRSAESNLYRSRIAALARKENPHKLRKDPNLQRDMTIEAMADTILIDWEGITDSGQPLPCTPANKLKLLAIPEIRELISTEAQDLANFRREATAMDAADIKSGD